VVTKRSVSLADEVAKAVEVAAAEDAMSFSAWLSAAAERQLRVRQGLRGVAPSNRSPAISRPRRSPPEKPCWVACCPGCREWLRGSVDANERSRRHRLRRGRTAGGRSRRPGYVGLPPSCSGARRGAGRDGRCGGRGVPHRSAPPTGWRPCCRDRGGDARPRRRPTGGELAGRAGTADLVAVQTAEAAARRNAAVVSTRQAALRATAELLGHDLAQYSV